MKIGKVRIPAGLVIAAATTFVLGLVAQPLIAAVATEQQLTRNVILNAIPFILIFVAILLVYITGIAALGSVLNDRIAADTYSRIERVIMGGILLGVLGMFQPWVFAFFRIGFLVLLFSTLGFILWSHITPARGDVVRAGHRPVEP